MKTKTFRIFRGNIAHCVDYPDIELIVQNGFVIVDDTKIISIGNNDAFESELSRLNLTNYVEIRLKKSQLLIPGFVDTHIHAVQYPNCGLGYDKPLLEWLNEYTFPLERKMKNEQLAKVVFEDVVKKTLSCGTTTAMYFASLYENISMLLVDSVVRNGQRAFVGKVNMTHRAPIDYIESYSDSVKKTLQFIEKVKAINNPLVNPVITPRFALSVDMNLMKELGRIAQDEDLNIQTHISENPCEVKIVEQVYGKNYTEVYDEACLLTTKTVLAHGVYLSDDEIKLIIKRGTGISHCPESNCYLKSGICEVKKLLSMGVNVGLGTDISGGASPSIFNAMRAAISSSVNLCLKSNKSESITWKEAFYMATLGGARALHLDKKIGNFVEGKEFDALIVDAVVNNMKSDNLLDFTPLEYLQKVIFTGDDRNVINVYVAGVSVK